MGYTHYWERPGTLPFQPFVLAVADCRRLCIPLKIPLGDADGRDQPTFTANEIRFNGHRESGQLTSIQSTEGLVWPHEDAHGVAVIGEADAIVGDWNAGPAVAARVLGSNGDGSYEAFHVERICRPRRQQGPETSDWQFNFCKTNYRPYDLCVQGCLIVSSHDLGKEHFRVSSDGTSRDWNDARDACQHILGYGIGWGDGKLAPEPPSSPAA